MKYVRGIAKNGLHGKRITVEGPDGERIPNVLEVDTSAGTITVEDNRGPLTKQMSYTVFYKTNNTEGWDICLPIHHVKWTRYGLESTNTSHLADIINGLKPVEISPDDGQNRAARSTLTLINLSHIA